ncbi:DUF2798 domain-containing protein [Ferrimonas pelagia]|uniref:DUF2798 domain-containing protein n=1 Tax=Ferrimonas pelagia TaxID=1177826 RepID=A0ABP9EM26_9GAMM
MSTSNTLALESVEQPKASLLHKFLVIVGMMSLMGATLTGVMTYINLGYTELFFPAWGSAFVTALLVMMPVGTLMMTLLTKLAQRILPNASEPARNALVGLCMAVTMESLMAMTTAANVVGFTDMSAFTQAWRSGFIAALPVGLVLMLLISLTIKPKIERFLKS